MVVIMEKLKNIENETIKAQFMFMYKGYTVRTSNIMIKKIGSFKIDISNHGKIIKSGFASVEEAIIFINEL